MLNLANYLYMAKNQILADLIKTIKYKSNLNQSEIAATIGVSKQYLSDTINGRFPFTDDLKEKLYEQFTYLQDVDGTSCQPSAEKTETLNEEYRLVPLINIDSVGGMHSPNAITDAPQYVETMIPFIGAQQGDICIQESGNSMSPSIPSGSILLIRKVPNWAEYFGYGGVYVIELNDGRRITKEIRRSGRDEKSHVLCHSFNETVADEELPKSLIISVWKVIKVITNFGF